MKYSIFHIICLSFAFRADAAELFFETEAKVKTGGQTSYASQPAGSSLQINPGGEALVISRRGFPILIMIPQSNDSQIRVGESMLEQALNEQLAPQLEKSTDEILRELKKAELLLQKRDLAPALAVVNALKAKYKGVSAVHFLSGTIHYLMNNKSGAIEDLESGLRVNPTDESAKQLLAKLRGGV